MISRFSPNFNRWTSKHCLHVSSSSPAPVADPPAALAQSTSDSYLETSPLPTPSSSFTTAYAMLLYNVCYLAYTQAIEIPLSQAGDVLSNLWSVCCSAELGRSVFLSLSLRVTDWPSSMQSFSSNIPTACTTYTTQFSPRFCTTSPGYGCHSYVATAPSAPTHSRNDQD
jgi:hypothetical protein